jgi:hypothetical protein
MTDVTVRYFSRHLLATLDINLLLARLTSDLPDLNRLLIEPMDENERRSAAPTDEDGIMIVRERIHIYVDGNCERRLRELEIDVERASP